MRNTIILNTVCILLLVVSLVVARGIARPFRDLDALSATEVSAALEKVDSPAEIAKLKEFTLSHCQAMDGLNAMVQSEARTLKWLLGLTIALSGMQLGLLVMHSRKGSQSLRRERGA